MSEVQETQDVQTVQETQDVKVQETKTIPLKIGIDFGGVCCYLTKDDSDDTLKYDVTYRESITMKGCVDALRELTKQGHILYLISFCGKNRANATREMLSTEYADIFTKDRLFFVKSRWSKNKICKYLGLDVLIDDRMDIIKSLHYTNGIQFRGDPIVSKVPLEEGYEGFYANSWEEVVDLLTKLESLNLVPRVEMDIKPLCHWEKVADV